MAGQYGDSCGSACREDAVVHRQAATATAAAKTRLKAIPHEDSGVGDFVSGGGVNTLFGGPGADSLSGSKGVEIADYRSCACFDPSAFSYAHDLITGVMAVPKAALNLRGEARLELPAASPRRLRPRRGPGRFRHLAALR